MTNTATAGSDAWCSVTEQSIFFDDGLKFVVEVLQPPLISTERSAFVEYISEHKFETSSNAELSKRLLNACALQHGSYYKFFNYRQRALLGLWHSQKSKITTLSSKISRPPAGSHGGLKTSKADIRPKGQPQDVSFSSHVSLLLLVPILESQSRTDPSLAGQCSELLLQCLQNCAPNSLAVEPVSCIKGLADLLCSWLQQANDEENKTKHEELARHGVKRESLVAALTSLACGRLSIQLFIQVLEVLQQQRTVLGKLPVGVVLRRALEYERKGSFNDVSGLHTSCFITSWQFEVALTESEDSLSSNNQINALVSDGKFLYLISGASKGLVKIGTGKHGTLRGSLYRRNADLREGWLAIIQGWLLFRPKEFDNEPSSMCYILDTMSLQTMQTVKLKNTIKPEVDKVQPPLLHKTMQLLSDEVHLYWLWTTKTSEQTDQENRKVDLCLQEFKLESSEDRPEVFASSCGDAVVVVKEEQPSSLSSPLPVRRSPTTPTSQKDSDEIVSCGLTMNALKQSAMFISSDMLNIVVPQLANPPGPMLLSLRGHRSPMNYCFSILDGSCVKHENVINSAIPKWQDLVTPGLSVCQDSVNGRLWSYGNSHISEWVHGGHLSCNQVSQQLGTPPSSQCSAKTVQDLLDPAEASSSLAHHITFLCQRLDAKIRVALIENDCDVPLRDSSDSCNTLLRLICNVLNTAVSEGQHNVTIAMLVALQTLVKQVSACWAELDDSAIKEARVLLWKLVNTAADSVGAEVQLEVCNVLKAGLKVLYPSAVERSALLMLLLSEGESTPNMGPLLDLILTDLAEAIMSADSGVKKERLAEDVVFSALKVCVKESSKMILQCGTMDDEAFQSLVTKHPDLSPVLQYLRAVFITSWRDVVLSDEEGSAIRVDEVNSDVLKQGECQKLSLKILEACQQILDVVLEVLSKLSAEYKGDVKSRVEGLEHVMKATVVGQTLPLLASVVSSEKCLRLPIAKGFMPTVTNVTVTATRVAYFISQLKSNGDPTSAPSLSSPIVPSPWSSPRKVESPHPVRDDYQCCKTVVIPGASCLFVTFDPRCATQYEYDKVILYAGKTTTGRKVAEYGGNAFGVGSRGVIRLGWPKEPVKVESDAVTIFFQLKSTRERNTPDNAVWGFSCIISTKEHSEKSAKLRFFDDLCLSLSVLTHSLLNVRYQGPPNTEAEDACQHLLDSKLLQRCVWPTTAEGASGTSGITITVESEKGSTTSLDSIVSRPSSKLSPELLKRLRAAAGVAAPTLRPSLRQALQPDAIEEVVLRCVINHLRLTKTVHGLELLQVTEAKGDEYRHLCDVMKDVFSRLNGLIRQLQSMAEMEQKWAGELDDVRQGILQPSAAFFNDFHLQEAKSKELELLCSLKNVEFDPIEQEQSVGKLIQRLETEAKAERQEIEDALDVMPVTKKFLFSVMECAELLCNVTIESSGNKAAPERSISHCSFVPDHGPKTQQSTSLNQLHTPSSPPLSRSLSAPSTLDQRTTVQEGIHDVRRLQRWRANVQRKHSRCAAEDQTDCDVNVRTFVSTVAEIFAFIGSDPDKAVTCSSFLAAARVRNERGLDRIQALQCMIELVTVCSRIGTHVPHLLSSVASILAQGPRTEELKCGGMVREVRDMFSAVVQAIVQLASSDPIVYRDSVLVLSVCPFSWHEEHCVMRSSLVYLLDKLCSLRSEKKATAVNLSAMAWAGFQVLLDRIVQWENDKDYRAGAIEWSGLAHQVSSLLSNYLNCVLEESRKDGVSARDALQYVMKLLHGISRSKLGEGILREPRTISTLLSLLLDRRAPPKLTLIVLKLCRSALPLMSAKNCQEVTLPPCARHYLGEKHGAQTEGSSVVRVSRLLLAKLGGFVLPSVDSAGEENLEEDAEAYDENDVMEKSGAMMCLYLHKRDDQPAHEVVEKVLSSNSTPFIFRVGQGSEMERAIKLDRELTEYGRGVLLTDTLSACLKKAVQWAQTGLVVSVGPVGMLEGDGEAGRSSEGAGDPESVCKARNSRLSRTESSRPFISGQVAHTMASEVISLLHGLLASSASETATIWASAVRDVLCEALDYVPDLMRTLEAEGRVLLGEDKEATEEQEPEEDGQLFNEHEWFFKARNVMASLCALGGFRQSVHSGCTVQICGEDVVYTTGEVVSVSDRQGVATVLLDNGGETYSDRLQEIPLARLRVTNTQVVFLSELSMSEQAVVSLLSILSSKETLLDQSSVEDHSENTILPSPAARILAELKTRASMVLSCQVQDSSFSNAILTNPSLELISKLGGECDPGLRLPVMEIHCQQLRKLFKDFVKPAKEPKKVAKSGKKMVLDTSRPFPPVRGCVFTEGYTCVQFMADPAAGFGLPRGTFLYASAPLPQRAPSFYWEVELCSLGDIGDQDPGPCISVGLVPWTDHLPSGWINPVGSCLLHSNGRAVLYRTGGLLQWKTVSLNIVMKENDIIGCGYKMAEDHSNKGLAYFTYNGQRLEENLDGVQAGLWPVIHIHKKNVRVRVNFGVRSFLYAEGSKQRVAADMWSDSLEDLREGFSVLPFALELDKEDAKDGNTLSKVSKSSSPRPAPLTIPKDTGKVTEYDPMSCLQYKLTSSYDRMTDVGPVAPLRASEEGTSQGRDAPPVDPARLLVKAWEDKVFPVIRRRFRSNTDRQSGLEQIKGALLAGMIDIAIATVADLYEDNGGIPASLQFPKLDDVKADANKVSAGGLRPGQAVIINSFTLNQASALPGFAVPDMKKTFGLTGVVKNVDKPQGLAEVETYNREEGTLMRFWYPIGALERPTAGLARSSSLGLCSEDRTRADIYCELLRNEASLTRMYCRDAQSRLLAKKAKSDSQIADILSLLQTLVTQLLADPQSDGTIIMTSPNSAPDPRHCLTANALQPSAIFFSEPTRLISAVRKLLSLVVEQDEEEVLRVVNTVCEGLKDAPLGGYHREVPISPEKQDEEVLIPGAAVTVVSCREDPGCLSAGGVANPRTPCVSISCYHGNQKLNKNGQVARYKVVQYPNATGPNTSGSASFNLYPDMILPCNRLHLHFLTSATEGLMLHLNAFPAEFFLSLVFIEVFVSFYLENAAELSRNTEKRVADNAGHANDRRKASIQKTVAFNLTDLLSSFLLNSNLPAVIKEIIYHLLAQLLRAVHHVESRAHQPHSPEHLFTLDLVLSRLAPLRTELQKLLEKELSATNTAALDFILNCNFEHSEFSSYLQALLGLVSAANEVSSSRGKSDRGLSLKEVREALQAAVSSDLTDNEVRSAPPTTVSNTFNFDAEAIVPPSATETAASSGPPSPKIKASERRGSVRRRKRGFGHGITSPTESMPWFDKIVSTTLLLRNLIHGDPRGSLDLSDSLTAVISTRSTALHRLLVITNIASTLSRKEAVDAIKKACRPSGGIHDSEVYIPEVAPRVTAEDPRREQGMDSIVKSITELLPSARRDKPERILGYAVVELKSASQLDLVRQAISSSKTLKDQSSIESNIGVAKVNSELLMEGTNELSAFAVFDEFLNARLFDGDCEKTLSESATAAMAEIFSSCALVASGEVKSASVDIGTETALSSTPSDSQNVELSGQYNEFTTGKSEARTQHQDLCGQNSEPVINKDIHSEKKSNQTGNKSLSEKLLTKDQICSVTPGNLLLSFFNSVRHAKESAVELVTQLLRDHGSPIDGGQERAIGFNGFVDWALARSSQDVRSIWKGLIACGYDLQFKRCTYFLPSEMEADHAHWPLARDHALVLYVDTLCRTWSTTPSRLMPDELLLSEVDLASENFHLLQGLSLRSLRSRFAFLKALNSDVERLLLPVTDLRAANTFNLSTATLLREGRGLLFYHTKVALLNHVLNHTAHRSAEDSPPEVSLDPLEALEADKVSSAGPQFCQAARDISALSSSGLRVKVATGGDPVFPLKVQLRGEQVLGSGGSFRHFMWLMARELQGTHVGLLVPCPSSAANKNKGKFIMKPGPMTYAEEKLLIFFGQLLGIALRSDIPLALDLLPCFWKSLLNLPLDPHDDLRETDILTYNYLRRFSEVENIVEFQSLCFEADLCPYRFVYTSLDGEEVELCKDGANVSVTWENHKAYVQAIRDLRLKELRCESRMAAVRCGLSSVVPLHVLTVMTPLDMEIRTCGQPSLDLGFLKAHTAYVAGVKETDVHIEYFWNSMESFSQDQLRKFVKFACNQERLPSRCTCQDGNPHTADVHVPPYPMKIGPPDGRGASDARYIRVETCMFMVKLPQYSTQEKMTEKLLYAINCREDPLTDMA